MNFDTTAAPGPPADPQFPCGHRASRPGAGKISRRSLLLGVGGGAAGVVGLGWVRKALRQRAAVFIARGQRYDGTLTTTIRDGLLATGLDPSRLRGKRVLLKPNLVEPTRVARHMTTHPAIVLAAAEIFRQWGCNVLVGEGPGHVRDTEMALEESGLGETLRTCHLPFADLNYEDTVWVRNRGRVSKLTGFYFPRSAVSADLIVSLPKMKTHHHVGVTAAMKNLYGVIPGIRYGWPKNVLHFNGIPETVYDINASLPKTIAIIDGITCMEGDGPILGTPKHMGLVLVGTVPAAVDATVARLMELCPERVEYLCLAANRLGPIDEDCIEQRGEHWQPLATPFQIMDQPHLQYLRAERA